MARGRRRIPGRRGKSLSAGRVLEGAEKTYLDTVCLALLDKATAGTNSYSPDQWSQILTGIRKEGSPGRYAVELAKEEFLCLIHIDGKVKARKAIEQAFASLVSGKVRGKRALKGAVTRILGKVAAIRLGLSPEESLPFLESMLSSLPLRIAFKAPGERDLPKVAQDLEKGRFKPKKALLYSGLQEAFIACMKKTHRQGNTEVQGPARQGRKEKTPG